MDAHEGSESTRRRGWIALSALVAVIVLALVAAFVVPPLLAVGGGGGAVPSASPSATPTVPPRDIVSPDAPRPSQTPTPAPTESAGSFPELSPVAPDATIVLDEGIELSLSSLQAVQGEATSAGETSGPAIRATVLVVNTGAEPLDLEYVTVNAYSGKDRAPAGTLTQPGGAPFEGTLAPGESAEGTYLFSVAETHREDVTITVDYLFGARIAVFRGDLR